MECALSFRDREAIDLDLATTQHAAYEQVLRDHGVQVISAPPEPDFPDAVFVEDTALVLDELAILTRPGVHSRRGEVPSIGRTLEPFRPLAAITGEATLEGGDVLRIGNTLFVGLSTRTNAAGIAALAALVEPLGYTVTTVRVTGCLHLKTAVTQVAPHTVLVNHNWLDPAPLAAFEQIPVPAAEPDAANTLMLGTTVLLPASFPETYRLLTARGLRVETLDVSELQKAEAGLTCCSLIFATEGTG